MGPESMNRNREYFDAHPEEVTFQDLNNFPQKLEGGLFREITRKQAQKIQPSMAVRDWYRQLDSERGEDPAATERDLALYSERYLDNSAENFYQDYDRVLADLGIKEQAEDLSRKIRGMTHDRLGQEFERMRNELRQLLLPAYLAMRKLGYRHKDLWE